MYKMQFLTNVTNLLLINVVFFPPQCFLYVTVTIALVPIIVEGAVYDCRLISKSFKQLVRAL